MLQLLSLFTRSPAFFFGSSATNTTHIHIKLVRIYQLTPFHILNLISDALDSMQVSCRHRHLTKRFTFNTNVKIGKKSTFYINDVHAYLLVGGVFCHVSWRQKCAISPFFAYLTSVIYPQKYQCPLMTCTIRKASLVWSLRTRQTKVLMTKDRVQSRVVVFMLCSYYRQRCLWRFQWWWWRWYQQQSVHIRNPYPVLL